MKLNKLVLPVLAISLLSAAAFTMQNQSGLYPKKNDNVVPEYKIEKPKTAAEIDYENNRDFFLLTAGVVAYQQALGAFAHMDDKGSEWRMIMAMGVLLPVPGHYLGLLLGEPQGVNPLLKLFSAVAVWGSLGYAMQNIGS